jgi:hypothetical protein
MKLKRDSSLVLVKYDLNIKLLKARYYLKYIHKYDHIKLDISPTPLK